MQTTPPSDRIANTARLRQWLERERGIELADYEALRQWSVRELPAFWQAIWDYFGLHSPTPCTAVLPDARMPGARWFEGVQVNFAGRLLEHAALTTPAIVFRNERLQAEGRSVEIGWARLIDEVATVAAALRAAGVQRGDRVAAYLPNVPQAVVAFLACASIGAVWSMTSPDMGLGTVRDRFRQIDPVLLIACDGGVYGGKVTDRRSMVAELLRELPSVRTLVQVPVLADAGAPADLGWPAGSHVDGWVGRVLGWGELLAGSGRCAPEPLPFDHPVWVVYSSGTTGLPKPIVHGHGGVLLEMLKTLHFHLDLRGAADPEERVHWYSSTGWVMWNIGAAALLLGTTVCIYDGHPSYPQADTLWRFAEGVKATFVGAGAAYYSGCLKAGVSPRGVVDVSRIRSLGATGSPLPPEAYEWGWREVKPEVWWAVISGGTDFASAFLGGTPELPTVPGEMQARCLGADVQAWSEDGRPLVGEVGELVCVQPLPSMPLGFWGDADGERYRASYFETFPGVWRHGDWVHLTPSGGAVVHGRSDATLNRHGHRLGTAELYRVVEGEDDVVDSLVVDIEVIGRPAFMPLFVVLRPGLHLDEALRDRLRRRIRAELSPRFVPDAIEQVAEVPRTLTGKKQELPVKKLLLGRELTQVVNPDACANPQAFGWYAEYARRVVGSGGAR